MTSRDDVIKYVHGLYAGNRSLDAIRVALSRGKKKFLIDLPPSSFSVVEWGRDVSREDYLAQLDNIDLVSFIHSYMRLGKKEGAVVRNTAYEKNASDQSKEGRSRILDVYGLINTAVTSVTLRGVPYSQRCLGLALLTGRRISEVGCSGVFEYVDHNHLLFAGQLKTKTREDAKSYIIPVLFDAGVLVNTFDTLPLFSGTVERYNKIYSKQFSILVKETYGKFIDRPIKVKDLRAIYLRLAWELMDQCQTGFALYASTVLGHGHGDMLTAQAYDDFIIGDKQGIKYQVPS